MLFVLEAVSSSIPMDTVCVSSLERFRMGKCLVRVTESVAERDVIMNSFGCSGLELEPI